MTKTKRRRERVRQGLRRAKGTNPRRAIRGLEAFFAWAL